MEVHIVLIFQNISNFFSSLLSHTVQKLKKNLFAFVKKINEILLLSKKNPYFYFKKSVATKQTGLV